MSATGTGYQLPYWSKEQSRKLERLAMLEQLQDVKPFVLNTIWESGGQQCPPIIVGLFIGRMFDGSARLEKKRWSDLWKNGEPL